MLDPWGDLLVEFTHELSQTTARDTRSHEFQVVNYMDYIIFGFSCVSRAANNGKSHENLGCVQDAEGKTGETFEETKMVIRRHRPRRITGENLKALDASTPDHDFVSDGDYIRNWFRGEGYWCESFVVRAEKYGSCGVRVRWLLTGMRSDFK